ncbi:COMM domain-containing protein 10-like [Gigantopelta aegis]|uniref:COMM domain-containing protein 10-like n=1 Tax=Gigantopelta aegis TaxID=1735272 RepID=UPI001B88A00E|nr:COMM domain-containing protein 10-like [Gigantopelta aegis]
MALMFTATPSIKKAVALINDLESSKFPLLLSRITQKLHLKDERTFSEEEEEKLQRTFELSAPDLELILQTLEFILQQAAYHSAKPAVLTQQLQQLELAEDKVQAIVQKWTASAKETVQKLRETTLVPKQLEDVNWRLNLQMAQANKSKLKIPNALFELGVKDQNTETKEKIRLEFTHDELYAFYNQLETIQKQLDGLS